jgi:hypothetical protein
VARKIRQALDQWLAKFTGESEEVLPLVQLASSAESWSATSELVGYWADGDGHVERRLAERDAI